MTDTPNDNGRKEGTKDQVKLYDRTVSPPLIERIRKQEEAPDNAADPLKVVIDLNLNYREGVKQARAHVFDILEDKIGVPETRIDKRKSKLTNQYVFARLTPEEIRALARIVYGPDPNGISRSQTDREIFQIWPDFEISRLVTKSCVTIKAEAARRSFQALGKGIVWAVLDSGIDGTHLHFKRHATLDLSKLNPPLRHMDFTQIYISGNKSDPIQITQKENDAGLTDGLGHGTHVAGIIAGEYLVDCDAPEDEQAEVSVLRADEHGIENNRTYHEAHISGVAPLCKLVSVKVLDENGNGEVSNILAALAKIHEINAQGSWIKIHGVNMSLGYEFDPEWFACGQSPICVEVNRLVNSGVVVVCSAGNSGWGSKDTDKTGYLRSGMLMTINDPGNAEKAITVGSTHRDMPHTFGASYFSSKGPTGDGRMKPDLLAPGERIVSCGAGQELERRRGVTEGKANYLDQSGTSMAAPHVSGAIAAFMSINKEFITQPEKIKQIFMENATCLGRDKYMQGAGLVDLMRAIQFQSVKSY
ncbi:S8 family peptidase [uncultured Roseobacter sp.]|uniref:S8 family peptidase n=1 Tax=uncultured Roseobacter sp. TaxID=114847 RepID=UPI00260F542A|nr:S8 family peptidase [uncultured Roseobacter sp.]